eukprot:gene8689-1078_t
MSDIVHSHDGKAFMRKEVVRLLAQTLMDLGYTKSAKELEIESNVSIETDTMTQFRKHVQHAEWEKAIELTNQMSFLSDHKHKNAIATLLRERYFQLIDESHHLEALKLLRGRLAELYPQIYDIKRFVTTLLRHPMQELAADKEARERTCEHPDRVSRKEILKRFEHEMLSPDECVPNGRLLTLLSQAVTAQRWFAVRDTNEPYSLFGKNERPVGCLLFITAASTSPELPKMVHYKLNGLDNEVYFVEFSPSGKYLAAAGKSRAAHVYDCLNGFTRRAVLPLQSSVSCISWSPDELLLAIGCEDTNVISLFDIEQEKAVKEFTKHTAGPCLCTFGSGGGFATASTSEGKVLYFSDASQLDEPTHEWTLLRAFQLRFSPDQTQLLIAGHDKQIRIFDLQSYESRILKINQPITSLDISQDGQHALVQLKTAVIRLYDLTTFKLVRDYMGYKQDRYIIRSCFGALGKFVLSGSEDGKAYIWHRDTTRPVAKLRGHDGCVNDVAWHPTNPYILATASDDHTVFVWGPSHLDKIDFSKFLNEPDAMLSRISEEVETSSCTSDHTYAEQSRAHLQNEIDALDVYDGWTSDDTDRSSF